MDNKKVKVKMLLKKKQKRLNESHGFISFRKGSSNPEGHTVFRLDLI